MLLPRTALGAARLVRFKNNFVWEKRCFSVNLTAKSDVKDSATIKGEDEGGGVVGNYAEFRRTQLGEAGLWNGQYQNALRTSHTIPEVVNQFGHLQPGETASTAESDDVVSVAGRVGSVRSAGAKLHFVDVESDGHLQLKLTRAHYSDGAALNRHASSLRRGDVVWAAGIPCRTKSGELSIAVREFKILAPCLRNFTPDSYERTNFDKRYRNRHLDLLVNAEHRELLRKRDTVTTAIRDFLKSEGFLEVETPVLNLGSGGAFAAKPFVTYHTHIDEQMFLRVAPELPLKRLIVGGFNRVFEIGKSYRNEGVDKRHNPEFSTVEFYAAYMDFQELVSTAAKLVRNTVRSIAGDEMKIPHVYKGRQVVLDFKARFHRVDYLSTLSSALGKELPTPEELHLDSAATRGRLTALCASCDVDLGHGILDSAALVDKLFSKLIEPGLVQPTLVTDFPQAMSPLAAPHPEKPFIAHRFELYASGMELANAYAELNDPAAQRRLFLRSKEKKNIKTTDKNDESRLDPEEEEFVRALECGMPPTCGFGLGIDRLVMLLTGQTSIKEVISFPLVRRSAEMPYVRDRNAAFRAKEREKIARGEHLSK